MTERPKVEMVETKKVVAAGQQVVGLDPKETVGAAELVPKCDLTHPWFIFMPYNKFHQTCKFMQVAYTIVVAGYES